MTDDDFVDLDWREGESLLFDDSFIHAVFWNSSHANKQSFGRRVIAFADVTRPGCTWWVDLLLRSLCGVPAISRLLPILFHRVGDLRNGVDEDWQAIDMLLSRAAQV